MVAAPVEIDIATAGSLRDEILATDPDCTIVIDLTAVRFCDSTGLAALLAAREHARGGAGRLLLRNPPAAVGRLLVITHLEDAFEIEGCVGPADGS